LPAAESPASPESGETADAPEPAGEPGSPEWFAQVREAKNPEEAFKLLAKNLPSYVNGQNVADADVVVWYTGSDHHEDDMRDEDRDTVPVLWTGFELIPQNLFDGTPFFP